jgi:hypothetical protein
MHVCPASAAPNRAADRSAPSKRRARRVVMCTCCSDRLTGRPGCALVCVRTCTRVRSMHACMLRAGHRAAAARAARRGTRPDGLATAYDGVDDMHGHWPEHSCWDLRLWLTQKLLMFGHIHKALNVDKKLIIQFTWKPLDESFKPN